MKQTAVELLLEKYKSQNTLLFSDDFIEALEMEEKQIIRAHGLIAKLQEDGSHKLISGETYYNETYKKDKL